MELTGFSELQYSDCLYIEGGKINWGNVIGGAVAVVGGIVECATGAGAVSGVVTISCGVISICDGMGW